MPTTDFILFACIQLLLFACELAYFRIADRYNIIDKPNERSSHTSITLRGGGTIFYIGMLLYAAFFGSAYPWFLVGLTLIAGVSFVDDVHSVPNKFRLVIQFTAMLLMFFQLGLLTHFPWWYVVIALIVCTGIINAYNFMDGINGITGGYSLAVILPLVYVNTRTHFIDSHLLIVATLSLLVFGFFNFRKRARCFAGDVGSVGMAFIVVFALGKLILQTGDFTYILFLALYGVDTVLTICHRLMLHENIGQAHRKHAYQLMANELGIPHVRVATFYMIAQLAISFGLVLSPMEHWGYLLLILGGLCLSYVAFMKKYYHLHKAHLKSK